MSEHVYDEFGQRTPPQWIFTSNNHHATEVQISLLLESFYESITLTVQKLQTLLYTAPHFHRFKITAKLNDCF